MRAGVWRITLYGCVTKFSRRKNPPRIRYAPNDKHAMKPRIILIGLGKWGKNYFEILADFEKKQRITFAGVVTRSKENRVLVKGKNIPAYTRLTTNVLRQTDAFIIATPVTTHYNIAKQCLPYADVLVEKPMSETHAQARELIRLAKRHKKILAVGHIFRFNHATRQLKKLMERERNIPYYIEGIFTGGTGEPAGDCGVVMSDMHLFDVLDYIFEKLPSRIFCRGWTRTKGFPFEDQASIILDYPGNIHAYLKLGWTRAEKERSLTVHFPGKKIHADLLRQIITATQGGNNKKVFRCYKKQPLHTEVEGFIRAIGRNRGDYVNAETGARMIYIIEKAQESMKKNRSIYV